jgi:hypothetical protein
MHKKQPLLQSRHNYDANVCDLFGIEFEPVIIPSVECSESNKGRELRRARLINRSTLSERHGLLEEEVLATHQSSMIKKKNYIHTIE